MAISEQVKAIIRAQAQNRCGYCRSLQMYVLGILEIDPGGVTKMPKR